MIFTAYDGIINILYLDGECCIPFEIGMNVGPNSFTGLVSILSPLSPNHAVDYMDLMSQIMTHSEHSDT